LQDSAKRASYLLGKSEWDCKAAAHAEIFSPLADIVDDPALALVLRSAAGSAHELMLAVGLAADGMIANSRRRLLAYIGAGDIEGAALEMEKHLRTLLFMCRLARSGKRRLSARQHHNRDDQRLLACWVRRRRIWEAAAPYSAAAAARLMPLPSWIGAAELVLPAGVWAAELVPSARIRAAELVLPAGVWAAELVPSARIRAAELVLPARVWAA